MATRDLAQLSEKMETLLGDRVRRNLHAQAHARMILQQLGTPETEWPPFSASLDERLSYFANVAIVMALDLVDSVEHVTQARSLLTQGAEALEFLCGTGKAKGCIPDELLKAAVAYHIAGHHARSYVLIQTATLREAESDDFSRMLVSLIRRDLAKTRDVTFDFFVGEVYSDSALAASLANGESTDDDAIANLGRRSLAEAISHYLEYVKTGAGDLFEIALERCRLVTELGRDSRHVDLWWWGRAIERVMRELGESSLWNCIGDIGPEQPWGSPIARYIESLASRRPASVSLWPSQRSALDLIKRPDAPSFCVRMPTSAGKTRIAELCIIRAMLENVTVENAKCIYIAPFRSLAAEIETSLRDGLKSLGIRVSEIYGGFDLTASDQRLIQETQVLIATPEKLDAALRIAPDLLSAVKLVVFDEGHLAGDISERGIRSEFLVNRLLWRLGRENCRHLFLSAVIPNPQDFARWIGGEEANIAESSWRPSRLLIGTCLWNGNRVRLEYTHSSRERLDHETFVPQFVRTQAVRGLPGIGARRNPFPHDAGEAYAVAAIRLASLGTSLAFVPQARQVASTARLLLKSLNILRAIAANGGLPLIFPTPNVGSALMTECLTAISDELGDDSEVASFVRAGIAVHHGNLPSRVRIAIERLVRDRQLMLIVATTTLGQGVNLPIRTVLVRGLQQDQQRQIDSLAFWNIAGRAGRALRENEGHVLFFLDETVGAYQLATRRGATNRLIEQTDIAAVIGLLHRALRFLRDVWRSSAPAIDFAGLCARIAEDDFSWAPEVRRATLASIFGLVDQNLLAISVESGYSPDQADRLQEVLRESLLFCQLDAHPIQGIDRQAAVSVLSARMSSIHRRFPQQDRRERFYKMGFDLEDCSTAEQSADAIADVMRQAENWEILDHEQRLDLLFAIAIIALPLNTMRSATTKSPDQLRPMIRGWLAGESCVEIIANGGAAQIAEDAGELSRIVERVCVYGLAWVINGFVGIARHTAAQRGVEFPEVAAHFPAMFKLGVPTPLAAVFATYLQMDRRLAIVAATACQYDHDHLDRAIAWLHNSDLDDFASQGVPPGDAERIMALRRTFADIIQTVATGDADSRRVRVSPARAAGIAVDESVLFKPRPDRGPASFTLCRLTGDEIGTYRFDRVPVPDWLRHPSAVISRIAAIDAQGDQGIVLAIDSRRLGS